MAGTDFDHALDIVFEGLNDGLNKVNDVYPGMLSVDAVVILLTGSVKGTLNQIEAALDFPKEQLTRCLIDSLEILIKAHKDMDAGIVPTYEDAQRIARNLKITRQTDIQ